MSFAACPALSFGKGWVYFLVFCFFGFSAVSAEQERGLWVECEGSNQTPDTPKKIQELITVAGENGVNVIFLQVYRHNRSWYNSALADNTPFEIIYRKYKIDPLQYTINHAHKKGIKVHAWINIYRIGKELDAPIVRKLRRAVITNDGKGKSLAQYPQSRLPDGGYWLDPGDPSVNEYYIRIVGELLQRYPQIDGIHLDYIRYPYIGLNPGSRFSEHKDFGYGKVSVERFKNKYGYSPLTMDLFDKEKTQEWDDWRREQISNFVRDAKKLIKNTNPEIQLSCAVQPWIDRAYLVSYQDWPGWLKDNIVDFVVLMNYSIDRKLVKYLSETAIALGANPPCYIGLGAYLLVNSPMKLYLQISDCQELKAKGIVLFSYDALLKKRSILKEISKNKWWQR